MVLPHTQSRTPLPQWCCHIYSPGPPYPNGAATYTVQDPLAPVSLPHTQSRTPLPQCRCHIHSPGPICSNGAATYTVQDPLTPMVLPHTQSRAHLLQWCCHIYSPTPPSPHQCPSHGNIINHYANSWKTLSLFPRMCTFPWKCPFCVRTFNWLQSIVLVHSVTHKLQKTSANDQLALLEW